MIRIEHLTHSYSPERTAIADLSLSVEPGEIFGFLGPNGSGKTTLFRILSTLIPPTSGTVAYRFSPNSEFILQNSQLHSIRSHIGVVFQSPSLDKQLTAAENLRHHGHLYGLKGADLEHRIDEMLARVGLADRPRERVSQFSGGMRRRVELAKGLLNRPRLLLLDEPSTGLDPGARIDLWTYLREIRDRDGVTILLTTHLMEEADHCSRLAIMDQGRLVAADTPANLKSTIGGDVITLSTTDPVRARQIIRDRFKLDAEQFNHQLRFEKQRAHEFLPELIAALPDLVQSVSIGKPTLEDVFIHLTGRQLSATTAPHS